MTWGLANAYRALFNTIPEREKVFEAERESLRAERNNLLQQRDTLQSEHDALQSKCDTLQSERDTLQSERDILQSEHDTLQSKCNNLWSDQGHSPNPALAAGSGAVQPQADDTSLGSLGGSVPYPEGSVHFQAERAPAAMAAG